MKKALAVLLALAVLTTGGAAQPTTGVTGLLAHPTGSGGDTGVWVLPGLRGSLYQSSVPISLLVEPDGTLAAVYQDPAGIVPMGGELSDFLALNSGLLGTTSITTRFATPGGIQDAITYRVKGEPTDDVAERHEAVCAALRDLPGWSEADAPSVQAYAAPGSSTGTNTITETIWTPLGDGRYRTRTVAASGPSYWSPGKLEGELEEQLSYYVARGWYTGQPPPAQ